MMRPLASLLLPLFVLFSACSDDDTSSAAQPAGAGGSLAEAGHAGSGEGGESGEAGEAGTSQAGSSSAGGSTSAGGSSQSDAGTAGSAGSPIPTVPLCQISCNTASDCASVGKFPENEWACEQGVCHYKGCSSDDVCAQVYVNTDYVCRPYPGSAMNMCQKRCSAALDCALDMGAFSVDHWKCEVDYCVYLGCTSDSECKTSMAGLDFRCRDLPSLGYKSCVKGCAAPADCAVPNSPAYAASTYECNQGACEYTGCPNDAACQQSMNSQKYVCK